MAVQLTLSCKPPGSKSLADFFPLSCVYSFETDRWYSVFIVRRLTPASVIILF